MRSTLFIAVVVAVIGCSHKEAQNTVSGKSNSPASDSPRPAGDSSKANTSSTATAPATTAASPTDNTSSTADTTSTSETTSTENTSSTEDISSTADNPSAAETTPKADTDDKPHGSIKPLSAEEQEQLLGTRLDGGMGHSFAQFANMFLVSSHIQLGIGVGLMSPSKEIAEIPLQSPFPASYEPTLREFLDAIALQTFSQWEYDPSSKYFKSDIDHEEPFEGIAIFEFKKTDREKPFEITLADGWKTIDKGNWVMHVPPSFPVGMDIYEMGTYSSDEPGKEKELADKIRADVALEWAQRVNPAAMPEDLKPAKVGTFDALYYESMIPSQLNREIKWRQWVFMSDNKCYFIVSTILPEYEDKIFPDVEKMLASFRIMPN